MRIDQNETDWYKARSRAIPAVKAALEQAGFALPEPIYRLRFDNAPALSGEVRPAPAKTPAPSAPVPAGDTGAMDVAPDDEIAGMVERERKELGTREKDLLDRRRPVE